MEAERKPYRCKPRCILFFGVLIWSIFIWSNSSRPAVESANQSLQVLSCFQPVFQVLHISTDFGHVLIRKAAHMTEFLALGVLWTAALLCKSDKSIVSSMFSAASLCLITALVDESIQLISPGRGSLVTDIWIDFGGGCIGILAASMAYRQFRHICRNNGAEAGESDWPQ